ERVGGFERAEVHGLGLDVRRDVGVRELDAALAELEAPLLPHQPEVRVVDGDRDLLARRRARATERRRTRIAVLRRRSAAAGRERAAEQAGESGRKPTVQEHSLEERARPTLLTGAPHVWQWVVREKPRSSRASRGPSAGRRVVSERAMNARDDLT